MSNEEKVMESCNEIPEDVQERQDFHLAFHCILNQNMGDDPEDDRINYVGIISIIMAMYKAYPEGSVARDLIETHLDKISDVVFGFDDLR